MTSPSPDPAAPHPARSPASEPARREMFLLGPEATDALGAALAGALAPGDTVLLAGPIGAGKSHLARAVIQSRFRSGGETPPEVPSPTYTLVQPYPAPGGEIVHADLYRLGDTSELEELGLAEAFGAALCLVEWPDRLGEAAPPEALRIDLSPEGAGRRARLRGAAARWADRLGALTAPDEGDR